jgi:DNA-directed RNA polymerase subunit F
MIVKKIISEDLLTLSEVKEILDDVKLRRADEEELGYELRRAIRHAESFSHSKAVDSKKMVDTLLELEKITPSIAMKVADVQPQSRDELRAIYAKERFTLSDEELEQILEIVFTG